MSDLKQPSNNPALDGLEAKLRRLPPPPVPDGLEARLVAAIPLVLPSSGARSRPAQRRWQQLIWVSCAAAVAAGVLLAVLASLRPPNHGAVVTDTIPATEPLSRPSRALETQMMMGLRCCAQTTDAQHDVFLDPAAAPFAWPLEGPVATTDRRNPSPDLFN
jgi:hypothetical protein